MPIPLREDFNAAGLRSAARESEDAGQTRRLLALAAICEGATRTEAARIGGVTLQIVRDWVIKLNTHGPAGPIDRKAPGQRRRLDDAHRTALAAAVDSGPIPAVHGVVRWRVVDPCQWLHDEFHVSVSEQTLSRELRELGYRKLSARPRHYAQAAGATETFKKFFPSAWTRSRASRVSSPAASTYIFGAICPQDGKAAGLILPWCNVEAMDLHLAVISAKVAPGRHAALLLDQAGWHMSERLAVPPNITIVPLPANALS